MKRTLLSVIAILAFSVILPAQGPYWNIQASGFATPSRGFRDLRAVDANIVWGVAYDGSGNQDPCQDFTKTTNGGATWVAGTIPGMPSLDLAMIDAVSDQKAWVVSFPPSGSSTVDGIYYTADGGTTWTRQATATFSNSASFPNCVHFFNENDGWCMGDPISGEFEIYTTTNGGTTWTAVPGANIPNPVSGEFGVVGYCCWVGDTVWFGTNKGRIYKSADKGLNWTVSAISGWSAIYTTPVFKDGMNGLAADRSGSYKLAETSDGGATWTEITGLGVVYDNDLDYVPGSPNTYVATGADATTPAMGVMYSFDGGHNWDLMEGTDEVQFLAGAWVDSETGWVGGFNTDATSDGMFQFNGNLVETAADFETADTSLLFGEFANFTNLSLNATSYFWTFEGGTPGTSNLETPPPIQYTQAGSFNVTLSVTGPFTNSTVVKTDYIHVGGLGVNDKSNAVVTVYPNPTTEFINVKANNNIKEVNVYNLVGQLVVNQTVNATNTSVSVNGLTPGVYNVKVVLNDGSFNSKVVVK